MVLCNIPCHDVDVFVTQSKSTSFYSKCLCYYPSTRILPVRERLCHPRTNYLCIYKRKSASANIGLGSLLWLLLHCLMSAGNVPVLLPMFQSCLCKDCLAQTIPCLWCYCSHVNKTPLLEILECANVATACTNYHKTQAPVTKVENSQGHMCPTN